MTTAPPREELKPARDHQGRSPEKEGMGACLTQNHREETLPGPANRVRARVRACVRVCVCVCVQATDATSPVLQVPVAPTTSLSPGKSFREPCHITFPGGTQQPRRSGQGPERRNKSTAQSRGHRAEVTEQRSKSESLLRPAPPSPQEVPRRPSC